MSDELSYEQQSYEIDDLWKEENIREIDRDRVKAIAARIPEDVRSIIDVGCGNGIFVNYLFGQQSKRYERLCGVDRSVTALSYVKTEKKTSSVVPLPFTSGEFDLAVCLEVIEHLPVSVYREALKELCRVAGKYVIISVPYDEYLPSKQATCPSCWTRFNPDYHMRTFVRETMESLLMPFGYKNKEVFFLGEIMDHYVGLKWYSRQLAKKQSCFSWYAICPVCGFRGDLTLKKGTDIPKGGSKIKALLRSIWPKTVKPRWIAGLYLRS